MDKFNRDLLVLLREESSQQAIEQEVELLNEILVEVEKIESLAAAHEIIDLNKQKVFSGYKRVQKSINKKAGKPFVFLNNLN